MSVINNNDKKGNQADTDENTDKQNKSIAGNDVIAAHEQADKDIEQDADLSVHSPNDDLDEGKTARLGQDRTDLV